MKRRKLKPAKAAADGVGQRFRDYDPVARNPFVDANQTPPTDEIPLRQRHQQSGMK